MAGRKLSRKKFISTAIAGIAGLRAASVMNFADTSDTVQLRPLGTTGIRVSPICFGAPRTNEESLIRYAIDKGINYIDTGRSYGNGNNEKLVGRAVSETRNKIVIQSKQRIDRDALKSGGKGKKGRDELRDLLASGLEASLNAFGTDYLDIFLYHDASDEDLLYHPEVLKFFSEMKASGVIRAHGFSAHNDNLNLHERNVREGIYDIMMVPFNFKGSFVHSVNGRYSEWDQKRLVSVLTAAGDKGIGVVAMKTCSGGKYSPEPGIEPDYREAVRWVIQQPFISSAAVAMANFGQVDEHAVLLQPATI
ncbi:MAG: aldo/keto reductase [Bacteroidales bacterium]